MLAQLFDCARPERVAGGNEDRVVSVEEFEGYFGEICGFSDAVDADEGDCVGTVLGAEDVGD